MVGIGRESSTSSTEVPTTSGESHPARKTRKPGNDHQGPIGGLPFLSQKLKKAGFDLKPIKLIMYAWRPSTKKIYIQHVCVNGHSTV